MIFRIFFFVLIFILFVISKEVFIVGEELILGFSFIIFIYLIFEILIMVFMSIINEERDNIKNEFLKLFNFQDEVSIIIKNDINYLKIDKPEFNTFCNVLNFELEKESLILIKKLNKSFIKAYNFVINEFLCKYILLELNVNNIKAKLKLNLIMKLLFNNNLFNNEFFYGKKIHLNLLSKNLTITIFKNNYLKYFFFTLQYEKLILSKFLVFLNNILFISASINNLKLNITFYLNNNLILNYFNKKLINFYIYSNVNNFNFFNNVQLEKLKFFIVAYFKYLNYIEKEKYFLQKILIKNIFARYTLQFINYK